MDLNFLDNVKMEELKDKDVVIKSIRFSKDELYMLKYCKFLNKRFATFVKELIIKDIKERTSNKNNLEINLETIKQELKNELLHELKCNNINKNNNDIEENQMKKEHKNMLLDFMSSSS